MKKPIIILLLGIFLQEAQAQDSLKTRHLEEVVVTGQYEPQSARNSVYRVRVIPMEVIQARGAVKLEDVLNTQLNLRFSQDATVGSSRLSMQGLSGQNIKILVDGAPLVGRQGVLNEIDINQINVRSIERIEIVEGPMSIMYGADALAGIINIITKKNEQDTWNVTAGLLEKSVGSEYGLTQGVHNQSLAGRYARGKWYAGIDLAKNYFGGWQGQKSGRSKAWYPKDQIMGAARIGFKPRSGSDIYYRLSYLYENIYNPGSIVGREILDQDYTTNRFMHQLQASYVFSDRFSFSGVGSYSDYSRRVQTVVIDTASGRKTLSLGKSAQNETTLDGITTRGFFLYKANDRIAIQTGFDINLSYGAGGRVQHNQGIGDYALFGSVEWKPVESLSIRPGLRAMYNSVYKAPPVVPSINTRWSIAQRHILRLSYGYGFRAPSLRELYFNFFDSNHSIEGNPDLKAEHSHSVNGTWSWQAIDNQAAQWSVVVGGFYNNISNKINYGQKSAQSVVLTYINVDSYQTHGFTLRNKLKINQFNASLGFSYTHTLFWSPEVVSTLSYKILEADLLFSLYYKYTGETLIYLIGDDQQDANPARTAAFHTLDITVQKTFLHHFTLTAGAQNIFDITNVANIAGSSGSSGLHSVRASTPIGYGRSYFVGISFALNRKLNRS